MSRTLVTAIAVVGAVAPAGRAAARSATTDRAEGAPRSPADVRAPGDTRPLGDERLSDEARVTRWATPIEAARVRAGASTASAPAGRLRTLTEDGRPEVVLVLRSVVRTGGPWVLVRFAPGAPGRPRTGWVRREVLGTFGVVHGRLVVDRRHRRARFEDGDGRTTWRAPVGIGAPGTPTPGGRFFVRERLRAVDGGRGLYGPWAIGTSAYARVSDWPRGGVVGLHGTDRPDLIPGRPSHGCVRLRNAEVRTLVRLVGPGTPVLIR